MSSAFHSPLTSPAGAAPAPTSAGGGSSSIITETATGFAITLALTLLCAWRLLVFLSVLMRYRRSYGLMAARCRATLCWCLEDEGEYAVLLASPTLGGPPKGLLRKVAFHAALLCAVMADVPSWVVLLAESLKGAPAPSLLLGPPPPLFLLHLLSYPFTFAALAILLDMWLMVADFHPERLLRVWRCLVLLGALCFSALVGWVIAEFAKRPSRTALQLAHSQAVEALALYSAGVLLGLALTFLIAGCMLQQRMTSVFNRHRWINLLALLRLNMVAMTCLVCFALRAADIFLLMRARKDYYQAFLDCRSRGWLGLGLCYGRWLLQALPVMALLYIMRQTGDLKKLQQRTEGEADRSKAPADHHATGAEDGSDLDVSDQCLSSGSGGPSSQRFRSLSSSEDSVRAMPMAHA